MPVALDEAALKHRLRRAFLAEDAKPIVFVVGAGLSAGAVPSTSQMLAYFQGAVSDDAEDLNDFKREVLQDSPPQYRYQAATQFVLERAGLDALNRTVRLAVLAARTPKLSPELGRRYVRSEADLKTLELDAGGWAIPQGQQALGRILALVPDETRGPVLTTNFDPLLEASISVAGLNPWKVVADTDGAVPPLPRGVSGVIPVVHLHGSWSEGDTLHTSAQLSHDRPRLAGSLRQLLTSCLVVVVGYAGWDDVLTGSLHRLVEEGTVHDLEVLWACHGDTVEMGALPPAGLPGRLQPYVEVNGNTMFPSLEQALRQRLGAPIATSARSREAAQFSGTRLLTPEFFAKQRSREGSAVDALSYFDGRAPSWVDALDRRAPMLSRTRECLDLLLDAEFSHLALLVEGPTGEGKSTALRQIAAELAVDGDSDAYWVEAGAAFPWNELEESTATSRRTWVIVDDADIWAREIRNLVVRLRNDGREDLRLVLASRDTDWLRSTSGERAMLSTADLVHFQFQGISDADAVEIVSAWGVHGTEGLGALSNVPGSDDRARILHAASSGAGGSSLLGALLSVRFGAAFNQHIRELMARLDRMRLPDKGTVLDAYLIVCLAGRFGLPEVLVSHLAAHFHLSESEADRLILRRLGREAAAQRHGEVVVPRHARIADAVISLIPEFRQESLGDLLSEYVFGVTSRAGDGRWNEATVAVAYCSQKIEDKDVAIACALAGQSANGAQLRQVVNSMYVLRKFNELGRATEIATEAWSSIDLFRDHRLALRSFFLEWARVEGLQGHGRNSASLNACAILDLPGADFLGRTEAIYGLNGLAFSFGILPPSDSGLEVQWRGVLAEAALDLGPMRELRDQAERYLGSATRDGYQSVREVRDRRGLLKASIKTAFRGATVGPARRYGRDAESVNQLAQLLDL
ncbi:P-loop NTPase [Nocardioides mangrovi]|uniref:SIR2 family protein n=1 Tax=Nocardioides mangrovi TaxID=2874580 RepID=A0ABS7UF62_9ACTN|nr:SIR2 family protein [Nocardioides mangrovi]MBZ5739484.1 SIR2 family protein [Nocardioides mangrovi]